MRIEKEFSAQSHGNYEISIDKLKINILTMSVRLNGISIDPVKIAKGKPEYRVSGKQLALNGVGLVRFLLQRDLKITTVKLDEPTVNLIRGVEKYNAKKDTTGRFSLYGFISTFAKSVTFKELSVENFDLTLYNDQQDNSPSLKSNNNSFVIKNFHIGPSTLKLPGYFEADTVALSIKHFRYTRPDSLYTLSIEQLNASFIDSVLLIDSITLMPNFNKKSFDNVVGKQTDRFDIHADKLKLIKIDLRNFLENHNLIAKSGDLKGFSLKAYRDKNNVYKPKHPPSLQKLLRDAPFYIKIDTLNLTDAYASYEEVAKGNNLPGRIYFNNINGKFTGITNDSLLISTGAILKLTTNSKLLNEGKLFASYSMPLNTESIDFNCAGLLTGFSMATLNGVLEPLAGIKVMSGFVDTLDFAFQAGENSSNGNCMFLYHDLKLNVSDKGPGEVNVSDRLKMFLANNFILQKENPKKGKPPEKAKLHFIRDKEKFMFNYSWKTIRSGIIETIGLPDSKLKKDVK